MTEQPSTTAEWMRTMILSVSLLARWRDQPLGMVDKRMRNFKYTKHPAQLTCSRHPVKDIHSHYGSRVSFLSNHRRAEQSAMQI